MSNDMTNMTTQSFYQFSGVDVDSLTSSEYTLVNIAVDMSGSVSGFNAELIKSIQTIIKTCKKSSRAENLMVRLITFNSNIYEEHGFKTLALINDTDYQQIKSPTGMTCLYDACLNSIEAVETYGRTLTEQEFLVNGVLYIITDGENTWGKHNVSEVAKRFKEYKLTESLESLQTFLIGININNSSIRDYLNSLNTTVGFDQFIDVDNASVDTLAKLANFVSKSISLQSQALGTGAASQALPSF